MTWKILAEDPLSGFAFDEQMQPFSPVVVSAGSCHGSPYTKGGWKATLAKRMRACVKEAAERGVPFKPFSLQDCRPNGHHGQAVAR